MLIAWVLLFALPLLYLLIAFVLVSDELLAGMEYRDGKKSLGRELRILLVLLAVMGSFWAFDMVYLCDHLKIF